MKQQLIVFCWLILTSRAQWHLDSYSSDQLPQSSDCYTYRNAQKLAQRCVPNFINAAFDREVYATNTCGQNEPIKYCQQTGNQNIRDVCSICDQRTYGYEHPAKYLTDFNDPNRKTWWQSETMAEGMQYPNSVNLTIHLGKAFDITYVRLSFISPRPESFAIYKKTYFDSEWMPWAYYSGSCRSTFNLPDKAPILPTNEAVAQCDSLFSDITPLTNGEVAFSTLQDRPSASNFEESQVLQEWVTATDIRIHLKRMNTYGDEIYSDQRVLQSYYYAISDLAIGGRCKCNGHANYCERSTGHDLSILVCRCQHGTAGVDCSECDSFHQDRPWRAATSIEANECLPCNCNGLSQRCFFDYKLYNKTGHGGHCIDCAGYTQGPHCESCLPGYWRRPNEKQCIPCHCDEVGSASQQCDDKGQCPCKPGVDGSRCTQCKNGFYQFGQNGCEKCACNFAGSRYTSTMCSPIDGSCHCKSNVEGAKCNLCKPGYFNLDETNPAGCTPCFCYGHSSNCTIASGFHKHQIVSTFDEDTEGWTAGSKIGYERLRLDPSTKAIVVTQTNDYPIYYYLPEKFLGDLRFAYNQFFRFNMRLMLDSSAVSPSDIKIVGMDGQTLMLSMASCKNATPSFKTQEFYFWLHPDQGWSPRLSEINFIAVLRNVSEFSVRGTYARGDVGLLYNFTLNTASNSENFSADRANWVENCSCGKEFTGQFCESCAPGFKRFHQFSGSIGRCIPCTCNNHGNMCEPESGACYCKHNTAGDDCSMCARGYYGNALEDGSNACKSCDCPGGGACVLEDFEVFCTECPEGTTGSRCQYCMDDWYRNSTTGNCEKCACNGNTDPNSIGNCDPDTGKCLRCAYFTTGADCSQCLDGFYGNASSEVKPGCAPCNCYPPGTRRPDIEYEYLSCNQETGQCDCLPSVVGRNCSKCQDGFYNIRSGTGCQPCDCALGSLSTNCDVVTGQCECAPGVTGKRCDQCLAHYFGFSADGCTSCQCNPMGSELLECDAEIGQCPCRDNVEGLTCDHCSENYYSLPRGCLKCEDCYELIQDRKNQINASMQKLKHQLQIITEKPHLINDKQFQSELDAVAERVENLTRRSQDINADNFNKLRQHLINASTDKDRFDVSLKALNDQIRQNEYSIEVSYEQYNKLHNEVESLKRDIEKQHLLLSKRHPPEQSENEVVSEFRSKLNAMAKQSQQILETLELKSAELDRLTDQHNSTIQNALVETLEAVFGHEQFSSRIDELQVQLATLTQQFENIEQLAQYYQNESAAAEEAALKALRESESIDLTELTSLNRNDDKTFVESVRYSFEKIQDKAAKQQSKLKKNSAQVEDFVRELQNITHTFKQAKNSNKKIEQQIELTEAARQQSKKTQAKAIQTLRHTEKALQTLDEFIKDPDHVVDNFRDNWEQIILLDDSLASTEAHLNRLEGDVKQNQFEIEELLTKAAIANQKSISFQQNMIEVKSSLDQIKQFFDDQSHKFQFLKANLTKLEQLNRDFEVGLPECAQSTEKRLRTSVQMNRKASALSHQIDRAAELLDDAMSILQSFSPASSQLLDQLEESIHIHEELVESMGVQQSIDDSRAKFSELELNSLSDHYRRLVDEKNKLQEIHDNIPTKCFNKVHLERE